MIKSVELFNIQSHKHSFLEFHSGVNVIIGPTDSGKSGILKGLLWPIENRPMGASIQSFWGGEAKSILTTSNTTVTRIKDKKEEYQLKGIETPFFAFGTSVPTEIQKALNISSINIQRQLDRHFLLSETPGSVAEHFNKVANLEVIDKAVQKVNQTLNKLKSDISYTKGQLESNQKEFEQFEYLEKMEIELEVLEEMESQKTSLSKQTSSLNSLISSIIETEANIETVKDLIAPEEEVNRVIYLMNNRDITNAEIKDLSQKLKNIETTDDNLLEYKNKIKAEKSVNEVLALIDRKNKFKKNIEILESELYNIKTTEKNIIIKSKALTGIIKELHDNMPDVCPLCEQEIIH